MFRFTVEEPFCSRRRELVVYVQAGLVGGVLYFLYTYDWDSNVLVRTLNILYTYNFVFHFSSRPIGITC